MMAPSPLFFWGSFVGWAGNGLTGLFLLFWIHRRSIHLAKFPTMLSAMVSALSGLPPACGRGL
jgi:hypothetical protein